MFNYREMNILQLNKRYGFTMENTPFIANNPYGYQIDINVGKIPRLYIKYKQQRGLHTYYPLSDAQSFEFEAMIFELLEKGRQKNQLIPTDQSEIS